MKNPKYSGLTQMDYRTVYSVLSEDVHSTIYGTKDNSRVTDRGIDVRLDNHSLDSLRITTTTYSMLLNFTNFITRHYKLGQAQQIKKFRKIEKEHHELYKSLEA